MSVIRPFKGLRPRPEMAKTVAAPPYDVLSSDEARELVKDNPNSFLRVNKPEVDFPPDHSATDKAVYLRGKANLERLVEDGTMCRDAVDSLYLYRLTWQDRAQTGLVCLSSCEEYNQNKIKKHEHTRPAKVSDRADHIETLEAQVGPVFCIFRQNPEIRELFATIKKEDPLVDFVADDGVRHELWVVSEPDAVEAMLTAFANLPATYIADGHHRSAAASEVARRRREANPNHTGDEHYNFFLNVIFPDDELRILPYNRVVKFDGEVRLDELFGRAATHFHVSPSEEPVVPTAQYEFGVYAEGKWFRMAPNKDAVKTSNPAEAIDSAVLTEYFLKPHLGIADIRTDERIDFVGGIRGVEELMKLVDSGKYDIAFSLFPVTVEQLLAVADASEVMPPKSTWFEPKLRSGMVVNLLNE